ncbi:MAG: NTP transferase domain-containing protein [Gammaproteobacteria bacterium]|jgi:glucose-1-phosphate cytidylyltransferase|nr:NTP transferase domain-containing protein [Gammaproteobacteria bacterium]MBT5406204.1 NTP transferase domain-containing protein [Gammaproteobacteria bacterium]MBT5644134.1 NTP transferase domain-containing protein [Gammaproteobacteria bacterium]MBT6733864.1 NTP transferase domain-containing protein [Gammaproteobacteria bacterium]MBT7236678.1 NTP transferase domain-containing protein [Gammaproteobacteria bacterium]|tara:strand:+ start:11830 stop:12543 length:714 start_codon:yes stop_codon:yes gene_type:complete
MKVIILAGGYGTRLGEVTDLIPKPMVEIGGKPIIVHIMELYANYGHTDFYIALGYKADVIKNYFNNITSPWNINMIDTGLDTLTGGRCKIISKSIGNETSFLTYGDGLSDINIDKLLKFHKKNQKLITVSAVHPSARFGELDLDGDRVLAFKEKPQLQRGWINGGFFVVEPGFFNYIDNPNVMLEREPIEKATLDSELYAYKHEGFWQCMDTRRDHELLEILWKDNKAPWAKISPKK